MKQFYELYAGIENVSPLVTQEQHARGDACIKSLSKDLQKKSFSDMKDFSETNIV